MLDLAKLREKRASGEKGFTLIELLVVVVIIGILIAIAIPVYLNYKKGANDKATQSDVRNAVNVLEQCQTDNAKYPATADVPAAGGAITGTNCTGQKLTASDGTTFKYTSGSVSTYILAATNGGGNSKFYCYNSTAGGSVTTVTAASLAAATC